MKIIIANSKNIQQFKLEKGCCLVEEDKYSNFLPQISDVRNKKIYTESFYKSHFFDDYYQNSYYIDAKGVERKILPQLHYLELHLSDICQLNCKGCSHFAPLFKDNHDIDYDNIIVDVQKLSRMFRNIKTIRILGGEPFLYQDIINKAVFIREFFPYSNISIVTNGLRLSSLNFMDCSNLIDNRISITISNYGVCEADYIRRISSYGVSVNLTPQIDRFSKFISELPSNKSVNYSKCQVKALTFYRNSKLYTCAMAALIYKFNERFNVHFPIDNGIQIDAIADGYKILELLSRPIDLCAYCNNFKQFFWCKSNNLVVKEDWL